MITIFTPSVADATNSNAQNLTCKEIVARLDPERFRVQMLYLSSPDERIQMRPNTELIRFEGRGNTARLLTRALKADIYFFPREGPLDAAFILLRRALRRKTALVTYIVGTQDYRPIPRAVTRSILEADAVVGNSAFVSETVAQTHGRAATTIHSGIRREWYYPPGEARSARNSKKLVVLYAGTFQARKRVEIVIEEAAKRPEVEFRLAGAGEEEAACRALASRLGCANVRFLGHLTGPTLGEEMRSADIFLFPSRLEGHPQVLGQAAACGLPCIARDVYHPDYVVNDETGFLVRSEAEIPSKLDLLLTQPDLRQTMSKAAVKHSKQFEWEPTVKLWEDLFDAVVARRRSKGRGERY